MDLTPYLSQLREDLATAAAAGDDNTRRTAAVLAATLEPAARLALMNALSDLAAEVTAELEDQVVELRLRGGSVEVVVVGTATGGAPTGPPPVEEPLSGDVTRVTLRLFEELKAKAEQAANTQGVSLNTWLSQAVQGHLSQQRKQNTDQPQRGASLRGWVQG
ncbi:toxin-antitoxin system HicB family antitoxin [Pseudonocardiaceae bacterium YIM PH 21723]|nr:toxin-antitoxin system HicB family antitoxin [Pseudonocardiaceae bacterium YIM PH 21723]